MSTQKMEKKDLSYRLGLLVDILFKGNVAQFARSLDINRPTIIRYLDGREPKLSFVMKVYEVHRINPKWLMYGQGGMYDEARSTEDRLLNEIDTWLQETETDEPWRREAFESDFLDAFPRFRKWRDLRNKSGLHNNTVPKRKIA